MLCGTGQHFYSDVADTAETSFCWKCDAWHEADKDRCCVPACACSCRCQDSSDLDLGIVGIPCPLFSVLNQRRRKEEFNPFLERLGFRRADWLKFEVLQGKDQRW